MTTLTANLAPTLAPSDARHERASAAAAELVRLRIGVIDVDITIRVPGIREEYDQLYPGWGRIGGGPAATVNVFSGRSRYTLGRRFVIEGDGDRLFSVKRIEEVLPHLEWAVNWQVVRRVDRYLQFHAAVVQFGGGALVMPGSPGSGKTTLTAGLMARGWRLLSDEFALVDPDTGCVDPYPKALCIKSGSFAIVEQLGLPLMASRRYRKGRKGRVAYVSAATMHERAVGQRCPVQWMVLPQYIAGEKPRLTPISRAEAAWEMTRLSFNAQRFGPRAPAIVSAALANARCFRLTGGDLQAACDRLQNVANE